MRQDFESPLCTSDQLRLSSIRSHLLVALGHLLCEAAGGIRLSRSLPQDEELGVGKIPYAFGFSAPKTDLASKYFNRLFLVN